MSASSPAPALRRALLAGREKREQRGGAGDGTIVVADLDPDEALALDSLLSPRRPVLAGTTLRIALSQFEAALRECGFDPRELYEGVGGGPVRDLPAERAARRELRTGFRGWLLEHEVVRGRPSVGGWLESAIQQGRVHPDLQPLLDQALRIVGVLPGPEPVQRTVLAAEMLGGDPHGLDFGTPLHSLTVSLLAAAAGLGEHTPAREVWSAFDVVVDPISSNVVGLNLPLLGESRVACLARGMHGTHVILTYGQLATVDLRWSAGVPCFSCENPSVVIAAERALGPSCPPLVCTRGRPSDAVRLLLSAAHHAGAVILHHGDFDEAGVQILLDLEDRYGAAPWRFDLASARAALGDGWTKLSGSVTALADLVRDPAVTIPEELVLDTLIADLRAGMTLTQNQR